jgi:UDP-N-acetylmuramoyl-L-alanyl-D-glutamate--2,6-diaminopimelate ligase
MRLQDLLSQVDCTSIRGDLDQDIAEITQDSRQVSPGVGFVAVRGAHVDGHRFVAGMAAPLVVVERGARWEAPAPGAAVVEVADSRLALAQLSAALRDHPSRRLSVVGITGTNGKTTTARLLASIGEAAGLPVGVVGTTGHRIAGRSLPSAYTTPDAPRWQALLAEMAAEGCRWVAAEVSSIGLAARRVDATRFEVGVFTNLSRDHLDYHGDMEAYAAAKARLFHELVAPGGAAVFNAADPAAARIVGGRTDLRRLSYGLAGGALTVRELALTPRGSAGVLVTPAGEAGLALSLVGRHNVENALAAAGAALALGASLQQIVSGLAAVRSVPGRLEPVPGGGELHVLVDYAHTDDALRAVLASLREVSDGRIITVFGCGGDRDRGKRPLMARVASEGSDVVVATSDNPRSEAPLAILEDLRPGLHPSALIEPDRAAAIALAIALAGPGDVVLIAGKGHEQYQEIAGVKHPFDDRAVAAAALEAR